MLSFATLHLMTSLISPSSYKSKQGKSMNKASSNHKLNTLSSNHIQSVSNNVFNSFTEMDNSDFTYSKTTKTKRILSPENSIDPKKPKSLFVTTNRHSSIAVNEKITCSISIHT